MDRFEYLITFLESGLRVARALEPVRDYCGGVERCNDYPFCNAHAFGWES